MKGLWLLVVGVLVAVVVGSSRSEYHRDQVFQIVEKLNGFETREQKKEQSEPSFYSSRTKQQTSDDDIPTPPDDGIVGSFLAPSQQFFTYWSYPSSSPTNVEAPTDANITNASSSYSPPPPPPHSEDSAATQIVWFYMGVPSVTSWVGVGFNTAPTMKGADMIVGSMGVYEEGGSQNQFAVIADRNTPNTEGPNTMPIVDAQEDVKLVGGYVYQGWLVLEFYRMVDTLDRAEDIRLDEATYLLWATGGDDTMIEDWGMGSFPFHSRYGLGEVDFPSGQAVHVESISSVKLHASLMLFAWIWLATVAVATARYMQDPIGKHWPLVHIAIAAVAILLTFWSFGVIVSHVFSTGTGHFNTPHKFLGLMLFLSLFAQIALGVYSYFSYDPEREVPPFFPDKVHWWLGRGIMVLAIVNIFCGLWEYAASSITPWFIYWMWLASLLILIAVLEAFHRGDVPSRSTQEKEYELMEQGVLEVHQNNEGLKLGYASLAVSGFIMSLLIAIFLD